MPLQRNHKPVRATISLILILLLIELLDELVDGLYGAAWPLIRQELQLSYIQVGLLLTIPNAIASLIEPILGIWADIAPRRPIIFGGGIAFAIALLLIALSHSFPLLLIGLILFYPASGSFVSLSQATLMDLQPSRHEQNMAQWTFVGSIGNVVGPLILIAMLALGQTWRSGFWLLAGLAGLLLAAAWRHLNFPRPMAQSEEPALSFAQGVKLAIASLRQVNILRWLTLLQFSNLMLDVLHGFLALYFVDIVGTTPELASLAIALWLGIGLLGDFLIIPLLENIQGLTYLRLSATLTLFLYPLFLLLPALSLKLILLSSLGLLNAGWYAILQGQLYQSMPGQSGTVLTLNNLFGLVGGCAPLLLGAIAQQSSLQYSLWLLLIAPVALLLGLPPNNQSCPRR